MIKPRPPHQAADKFLRLARLVAILGMDFEDAIIGVDHELIESIGASLPKLSRAMQTLSQDLRRKAMTPEVPPPPPPKPTPILDVCGVMETGEAPPPATEVVPAKPTIRTFVALIGRNPLCWILAYDANQASIIARANRPEAQGWTFEEWEEDAAKKRGIPEFWLWSERNPLPAADVKALADAKTGDAIQAVLQPPTVVSLTAAAVSRGGPIEGAKPRVLDTHDLGGEG